MSRLVCYYATQNFLRIIYKSKSLSSLLSVGSLRFSATLYWYDGVFVYVNERLTEWEFSSHPRENCPITWFPPANWYGCTGILLVLFSSSRNDVKRMKNEWAHFSPLHSRDSKVWSEWEKGFICACYNFLPSYFIFFAKIFYQHLILLVRCPKCIWLAQSTFTINTISLLACT